MATQPRLSSDVARVGHLGAKGGDFLNDEEVPPVEGDSDEDREVAKDRRLQDRELAVADHKARHDQMRTMAATANAERLLRTEQWLALVAYVSIELRRLQAELDRHVRGARTSGATWEQVGNAAGLSVSAANQRWSERARAADTRRKQELRRQARGHQPSPPSP